MSNTIKVKIREKGGVNQLRQDGFVPGVVYGRGVKNTNVFIEAPILEKVLQKAGESTLLELTIEGDPSTSLGAGKPKHVLIHDVQRDPVKDNLTHVDFLEVSLDRKIKAEIPLLFVGDSPAVKELNGTLIRGIQHVEVEALPQNLPHNIEVDISFIKTFEDHIKIADLKIPAGVKILDNSETILASVIPPRTEEELESLKGDVVEDVTKVEGVVKQETPAAEADSQESKKPAE
ncbi:MAG: 50S ribosomal protein L25 [bacterium]|nr:50S ribosomal protein L25 [bacterium]